MSTTEYSFTSRRRSAVNQPAAVSDAPASEIKRTIMEHYDRFINLQKTNETIGHLSQSKEKLSQEITQTFALFQSSTEKEITQRLNEKLNHLTDLYKKLETDYDEILKKEMTVIYQQWPGIYEKFKEGIDRETLENVLTVFEHYQSGKVSANQAVNNGIDFTTKKYKLPADFFDKSCVDQFNKNLHKV